jgi:hypothetical protein
MKPQAKRDRSKPDKSLGANLSIRLGDLREPVEAVARRHGLSVADVTGLCVQRALPVIARHLEAMAAEIDPAPPDKDKK